MKAKLWKVNPGADIRDTSLKLFVQWDTELEWRILNISLVYQYFVLKFKICLHLHIMNSIAFNCKAFQGEGRIHSTASFIPVILISVDAVGLLAL